MKMDQLIVYLYGRTLMCGLGIAVLEQGKKMIIGKTFGETIAYIVPIRCFFLFCVGGPPTHES